MMGVEAMLRWREGSRDLVSMPRRRRRSGGSRHGHQADLLAIEPGAAQLFPSSGSGQGSICALPSICRRAACWNRDFQSLSSVRCRTWSLRPGRLMLEIEGLSDLEANAQARAAIRRLDEIGVKLSIDDARAPLSSLFWLATMPFQEIKFDLSIARDWVGEARSEGVLRSLIELVHKLKLDVVAVGVADRRRRAAAGTGLRLHAGGFQESACRSGGFCRPFRQLAGRSTSRPGPNIPRMGDAPQTEVSAASEIGNLRGARPLLPQALSSP